MAVREDGIDRRLRLSRTSSEKFHDKPQGIFNTIPQRDVNTNHGGIVALRPVAVESIDYATREYGATAAELDHFEQRTHGQFEKARKEGKLHNFTGNIKDLLESTGD